MALEKGSYYLHQYVITQFLKKKKNRLRVKRVVKTLKTGMFPAFFI